MEKVNIKSYVKFEKEIRNLIDFYKMNSVYLDRTEDKDLWKEDLIALKSQEIDSRLEVDIPERTKRILQYRKGAIFTLRELIYVRLISALEVFLIDSVKDVFLITKTPFKHDGSGKDNNITKYPLSKAQLLSFSSISEVRSEILRKETRKLSSKGFPDILKYYKKFNVDLGAFDPGKKKMVEYHEIRHILVHRLGKVDKKFRKKYGYNEGTISLTEEFLITAINDISKFCISAKKALNNYLKDELINQNSKVKVGSSYIQCSVKSKIVFPFFISPEFEFWHKDELRAFKDIQSNIKNSGNRLHIELWGHSDLLSSYIKELKQIVFGNGKYRKLKYKRMDWEDYIESLSKQKQNGQINGGNKFIEEKLFKPTQEGILILKVKELLPEQPWKKGIHKKIAEQLNIPNGRASKAIQKLIRKGHFKHQINGEVVENET